MSQDAIKEGVNGAVLTMDATRLHIITPVQDFLQACVLKCAPYIHALQERHIPYVRSGKQNHTHLTPHGASLPLTLSNTIFTHRPRRAGIRRPAQRNSASLCLELP